MTRCCAEASAARSSTRPRHDPLGRGSPAAGLARTAAPRSSRWRRPRAGPRRRGRARRAGRLDRPARASSIAAAVAAARASILVAVGGCATTDGGRGAIEAIRAGGGLGGARLVVLCDVRTPFEDAARVFGPQKGADAGGRRAARASGWHGGGAAGRAIRAACPMTGCGRRALRRPVGGIRRRARAGRAVPCSTRCASTAAARRALVVAGEGCLDEQTLRGKLVGEIGTRARRRACRCTRSSAPTALDPFGKRIIDLMRVFEATDVAADGGGRRDPRP